MLFLCDSTVRKTCTENTWVSPGCLYRGAHRTGQPSGNVAGMPCQFPLRHCVAHRLLLLAKIFPAKLPQRKAHAGANCFCAEQTHFLFVPCSLAQCSKHSCSALFNGCCTVHKSSAVTGCTRTSPHASPVCHIKAAAAAATTTVLVC